MQLPESTIVHAEKCGAKNKQGGTCQHEAGWGTWHVGEGKCKMHGGASPPGPYSMHLKHDKGLLERVEELKQSPNLSRLDEQIALSIAMMERAVNKLNDNSKDTLDEAKSIAVITRSLAAVIETKTKIDQGHYMSPEHVREEIQRAAQVIQNVCGDKGHDGGVDNGGVCKHLPLIAAKFRELSGQPISTDTET